MFMSHGALAQQLSALNSQALIYRDYSQPQGNVNSLHINSFPKWATIDMQIRERGESQSSEKYVSGYDAIYDLSRVWGGLELRPSKSIVMYAQFIDSHALGLPLAYVAANQRNSFDLRQGYLAYHARNLTIIAGRQELRYGNERILGISNWTNTSRTWDGFLGRIGDKNRLDLFSTSAVVVHPTSLDTHGAGLNFHGAVGTITTWVPRMVLQPFVYVKALPRVLSQQKKYGTETEVTPGVEASGKLKNGFYFDLLGAMQRGSYSNDSIRAAAGYVKTGYFAEQMNWKPRLAGEYDYASGNPQTDLKRIGTFDFLYPGNHNAFGLVDLFGFENIKQERVNLDLTPAKHMSVLIQHEWLQVATVHDNVYSGSASATVKAPTKGFLSDNIGRGIDASGQYAFLRNNGSVTLNAGVGHFSPGALMRENKHGAPLTMIYFGTTYRFKLNR